MCMCNADSGHSGVSDRLMLFHPYTVTCFLIKPVQPPLWLLPGPGLAVYVSVCIGSSDCAWAVCLCLFAFIHVSIERYRKGYQPHQSPTQSENGEMDEGCTDRWMSPRGAEFGEKERGRQGKMDE